MVRPRSVELRLLECLVALVAERNVTAAAKAMAISQPRMSNALSRLREVFNDPLLVRSGQKMMPTERAVSIVDSVRTGLAHIDTAFSQPAIFDPQTSTDEIVVVMSDYVSLLLMPPLTARIQQLAPGMRLSVKQIDPPLVSRWIEDDECHLAFGHFIKLGESLRASVLFHDTAACIVSDAHPLIGDTLTIEDFVSMRHAIVAGAKYPISTLEHLTDKALLEQGLKRTICVRVPTPLTVARIVARTDMIATVPRRLATDYAASLPIRVLPTPLALQKIDITMVWHERLHRAPAHVWLRQQIRAVHIAS